MRVLDWSRLTAAERRIALSRPVVGGESEIRAQAAALVEEVRRDGDAAVRRLTRRFDSVDIAQTRVMGVEFAAARAAIDAPGRRALERAIDNVRRFHAAQRPVPLAVETSAGVLCERITRAIRAVGLYVPAGSAPLPSTAIMLAVPAELAGCEQRLLCTPPRPDGRADPAVLVAAELCGVTDVFKIGGVQAIAALAYGTESVPKVDKIFGPGNAWVTAAKQIVAGDAAGAALDLPAGPSEVLVVADDSARAEFIAADLLAQAEHDPLSQALLVTDSAALAQATHDALALQLPHLSRKEILRRSVANSRALVVADVGTALQIANDYAPEHLLLEVREPRRWLEQVRNAGSVFLGHWTPEPMGDYCSGTNHVLPTYGFARAYSGLSLLDFVKRITVQEISAPGLLDLGPTAATLADLERLDAHAAAVRRRLRALETL